MPIEDCSIERAGSGFLIHTEKLERFLDEIYAKADVKISIKTRIGKYDADEWGQLLDIYNKYPVEELIVHPRVQQQFYKGHPDLDAFCGRSERMQASIVL